MNGTNGTPNYPPLAPAKDDPAWQPPTDPAKEGDARGRARIIYREIPLVSIQTSWTMPEVRTALSQISSGQFERVAELVEAIIGDPRVQATMGSRTGGLFGRPVRFSKSTLPGVDADKAQECLDAWKRSWPRTLTEPVLSELMQWAVMLGFGIGELLWDVSAFPWIPYVRIFHPRFTWFHPTLRALIATTLDGQVQITPGDATWILHAPHGEYRGWMRGSVRAIAQPWWICAMAYRDFARWSEVHGFPAKKAKTPAGADEQDKVRWLNYLANLGQESVIELPQGVDKEFGYDVEYLEAKDGSWQGFDGLIKRCEISIVLALLFQNLTTEVKEGSFAAAREHGDVRQSALEADARALAWTIYTQIARPFAQINFGDADLAPMTEWDILPTEQREVATKSFLTFAQAVQSLRESGLALKAESIGKVARAFGIDISADDFEDAPIATAAPAPAGDTEARSTRVLEAIDELKARKGEDLQKVVRTIRRQLRRDAVYFGKITKGAATLEDVIRNARELQEAA